MTAKLFAGGWQRWFAWHPVLIHGKWRWLCFVARDQYANKPCKYRYGLIVKTSPPLSDDKNGND